MCTAVIIAEVELIFSSPQVDYFERAKCLVSIPLLQKQYQQQIEEDRHFHEEQEEERVSSN